MVTRRDAWLASALALTSGLLMAGSLLVRGGAPPSTTPARLATWISQHGLQLGLGTALWVAAVLAFVAFAIAAREALWASVLHRPLLLVLFVQGAAVYATIAVVDAAVTWSAVSVARNGAAEVTAGVWAIASTLHTVAAWGLTVPLVVIGLALFSHSTLGAVCTVTGGVLALGLVLPVSAPWALGGVAVWLAMVALTLAPARRGMRHQPATQLARDEHGAG